MRRTLIIFIVLFFGYASAIQIWQPEIPVAENQETNNIIRAESLVYGTTPPVVMVGSSLIGGFHRYANGRYIGFLPQSGGSAIEGLDVLRQVDSVPVAVIIETNALHVKRRPDFSLAFQQGLHALLAKKIAAFRACYRPANLYLALFHGLKHSSTKDSGNKKTINTEAQNARLEALKELYIGEHDWQEYQGNLDAIADHIHELREKGSRIVLLELPVHQQLIHTDFHLERREHLMTLCKKLELRLVDLANEENAEFTDGIHFTDDTQMMLVQRISQIWRKFL